jgi:hypothetical protein
MYSGQAQSYLLSTQYSIYRFPGHGSFLAMTACTRKDNPQQLCAEGNKAKDALYWKLRLVKTHLLATSVITHNKEFCMFMQSTQSTTLSPHTPVANPTFYRRGWNKTRKFITKS